MRGSATWKNYSIFCADRTADYSLRCYDAVTMRIAVLADIHGNLLALEAVITDMRHFAPDLVLNLGDHVSGPLWAAETADLLISLDDWVQIRGNHDRQLLEFVSDAMGKSDRAAWEQLTSHHKTWLEALPATAIVDPDILLCHGTPRDDCEYLLEDVLTGLAALAQREEIQRRCGSNTGLILCGHSHVPRFIRLDGSTSIANPGSVGLPGYTDFEHVHPHVIETGSPHARYLLLDGDRQGWTATFRFVEYEWERAAQMAADSGRPDWAMALRTGYVPRQPQGG